MATNRIYRSRLIKIIYRPADILEGHIVCNMLRANGVDAELLGEYQQGGIGELMPADFASVQVPDQQLGSANLLIEEYAQKYVQEEPIQSTKMQSFTLLMIVLSISMSLYLFFTLFIAN